MSDWSFLEMKQLTVNSVDDNFKTFAAISAQHHLVINVAGRQAHTVNQPPIFLVFHKRQFNKKYFFQTFASISTYNNTLSHYIL